MSEITLEERDPVADDAFRALLDLYMVLDSWPLDERQQALMEAFLECEASKHGYDSWVEAYHEFNTEEDNNDE